MGETLTNDERSLFKALTGREKEPGERVEELWAIVGRRGGKTRAATILALFIAALCCHEDKLVSGERPLVLFLGQNQKQARVARDYAVGVLESTPFLRQRLANQTAETISLSTGVDLEIRAASFRGLRGVTCVAVIADEIAFWRDSDSGSSNADSQIIDALRPTLATTQGPLIAISSPYSRRGELFNTYSRHYGAKGDPLIMVGQGASRDFNPSLPERIVARALERDEAAAKAEYLGQFRTDIEGFISRGAVEACVTRGVFERPPLSDVKYFGFVDPSGGMNDAMTLAIGHKEHEHAVLDVVREVRPPFSPEFTVNDFATILMQYRVSRIQGDRYAGEWPREQFRKWNIVYEPSAKPKSDLYLALLPAVNSRGVDLLDNKRLLSQLIGLERRTARGGRDSIDHGPGRA